MFLKTGAAFGTVLVCAAMVLMMTDEPLNARSLRLAAPPRAADPAKTAFFETKIRPLLIEKCQPCHNATVQQDGVRLDTYEDTLKTLVPGKPADSKLLTVVHYTSKIKMPPSGKLAPTEIAALEKWVTDGAVWGQGEESAGKRQPGMPNAPHRTPNTLHWSFRPVQRPLEPPVDKSGIDAFVLARLEKARLTMAARADRATLLRRLSFDLTGLPPTPAEMTAFLADTTPNAYVRQVDRLLASPRFGERWGRHWLDVARYADSNGLDENLTHGYAWRYRDWVIDALNRDLPYDAFLQHQIAGDLMPTDDEAERNRRITATGYLTLGAKVLAEQDKPKLVMDIVDEQIDVVSKSVIGLTVACARCHDHKFDPVSTKDYYALAGIFKSTRTMGNLDFVSRWNERRLPSKTIEAEIAKYNAETLKPLEEKVNATKETARKNLIARLKGETPKYVAVARAYRQQPGAMLPLEGREVSGKQVIEAENYTRGNAQKNFDQYGKDIGVIHTGASPTHAEWDISVPADSLYQWDIRYSAEQSRPIKLIVNGTEILKDACGNVTGSWTPETQTWETVAAFSLKAGKNVLRIERDGAIPHIDKLAFAPLPAPAPGTPTKTLAQVAKENDLDTDVLHKLVVLIPDAGTEAEAVAAVQNSDIYTRLFQPERLFAKADTDAIQGAEDALQNARKRGPQIPVVMAVEEAKPENVRVHVRGSTQNLGDVVPRGFPKILCKPGTDAVPENAGSGRLTLAKWLTRPDHPLTARVAVNRVWQHLFGVGLVTTPDNWGLRGAKPSHPELLDYLAATFVTEDKWRVKSLIRRIVLSDTYRQASTTANPQGTKIDPDNRLLWRQNLRRLEVEPIRDAIVAVAGTLDTTTGGTLLKTNNGDYVTDDQSTEAAQYTATRRAVYLPVVRNAVYNFFQAFDFGDPTLVNAQRPATTVAPQALYLLNSPFVREQAIAFARSLPEQTDTERLKSALTRAYSRPPTPLEIQRGSAFLTRCNALYAAQLPDPQKRKEAVWAAYCQVLFASNEFVYVL